MREKNRIDQSGGTGGHPCEDLGPHAESTSPDAPERHTSLRNVTHESGTFCHASVPDEHALWVLQRERFRESFRE
jgi:hypothetical protein